MRRWRRLRLALAAVLLVPATAFAQQPAVHSADVDRVRLIERVRQSVVQVLAEPKPPAADRKSSPSDKALDDLFRKFGSPPERGPERGSGFAVGDGLVLTAAHLVDNAQSIVILRSDGQEEPASLVALDERKGFALLKAAGAGLPALQLSTRRARAGEEAVILGWMGSLDAPLALRSMVMGDASTEALRAKSVPLDADYVALDAILPDGGFGGGPVVDRSGVVIGLVSALFGSGFGRASITLMVPSETLVAAVGAAGR